MVNTTEITAKVKEVIAEMLGMDESEIEESASLIDEYGAESIDFLDVSFKLNKDFGIKLFRGDFLAKAQEYFGESLHLLDEGKLTPAGVDLLKARLPEAADNALLEVGMPKGFMPRLYCAQTWTRLVTELVDHGKLSGEDFLKNWLTEYKNSLALV